MLRVFEAFSGIGTQRMALRNLRIEHEVVCIAEIDKFAIRSYEAIHGETLNLGDVSKIDPNDVPDHDLFTYSFPCQDISVAGKGKGFEPESGTRSSLLWECEKIIKAKRPKYLLMENVKALIFKKFKPGFEKWLRLLEELGYTNYWQVLNAKDYGIPQNRERVFCVSILGTHEPYVFPKKQELTLRLKDVLEDEVDERFYINNERADKLIKQLVDKRQLENLEGSEGVILSNQATKLDKFTDHANALLARDYKGFGNQAMTGVIEIEPQIIQVGKIEGKNYNQNKVVYSDEGISPTIHGQGHCGNEPKVLQIGNIVDTGNWNNPQRGRIYSKDGISPCLNAVGGGGLEPKIVCEQRTDEGLRFFKDGCVGTLRTIDACGDKRVLVKQATRGRVQEKGEIVPTLTAGQQDICYIEPQYRIRKLTPKECWRLMGISDEDFEKAQEVNSNTQLYKQAGNAIVVDVLEGIFRKLFLSKSKEKGNKLEEQLKWLDELLEVTT